MSASASAFEDVRQEDSDSDDEMDADAPASQQEIAPVVPVVEVEAEPDPAAKQSDGSAPQASGPRFRASLVAIGTTASDKTRQAISAIQADQWNTTAWEALVVEAQNARSGGLTLREIYHQFLLQFPTSARHWKFLAQYEQSQSQAGDTKTVDAILEKSLFKCVSLDLWLFYIEKVKKSMSSMPQTSVAAYNAAASTATIDKNNATPAKEGAFPELREGPGVLSGISDVPSAYELAIQHFGLNLHSYQLWNEYINYLKALPDRDPTEMGHKVSALRMVYQRALSVPMENLEKLWKDYEQFETVRSEHLAKNKFIPETLPRYQSAKTVYRDRKHVWEGCDATALAVPPKERLDAQQTKQLESWRRRIDYEAENPERVDPHALYMRRIHTYAQCLVVLRHYPEIWHELALFYAQLGGYDKAMAVYKEAIEVLPTSELLRISRADMEEERGNIKEAKACWKEYLNVFPSSTVCRIMYQKFLRRTEGKEAARSAFAATRKLRMSGKLGYEIYLAHAALEQHVNREPDVAQRVLEYGLSQHGSFIKEPAYVIAYVDTLLLQGDDVNLRVLLERVLDPAALPLDKAASVWDRFIALELWRAQGGGSLLKAKAVEDRVAEIYPTEAEFRGLLKMWRRCHLSGIPATCLGSADTYLLRRSGVAVTGQMAQIGGTNALELNTRGSSGIRDSATRKQRKKRWDSGKTSAKGEELDTEDIRKRSMLQQLLSGPNNPLVIAQAAALAASTPPLIPTFLAKLYNTLPRHTGPTAEVTSLLSILSATPMPPREAFIKPSMPVMNTADQQNIQNMQNPMQIQVPGGSRKRQRERGGGMGGAPNVNPNPNAEDSDDDVEVEESQLPVHDVFRLRQRAKIEPHA